MIKAIVGLILIVVIAIFIIGAISIPFRFLMLGDYDIENAKTVTKLELFRFELVGRPENLRTWLSKQDGAPGQEVAVAFLNWGLSNQADFELILDGMDGQQKQSAVFWLSYVIVDRQFQPEFDLRFANSRSPVVNEIKVKSEENRKLWNQYSN